jgi:integrase
VGTLRAVGDRWTVSHLMRECELAPGFTSPVTRVGRAAAAVAVRGDRLGSFRVSELTPALLAGAAARWRSCGLSDYQVRARVAAVRSAVGWAIAQDYLTRDALAGAEPVPGGRPRTHAPVGVVREIVALARRDLEVARSKQVHDPQATGLTRVVFRAHQTLLLVSVVADAGLRRGELAGLRTDDLCGRELSVERAVKRVPGGVTIGPPKTYRSGRVTVSAATARLWQGYVGEWYGPGFVSGVDWSWLLCARPGVTRPLTPESVAARFTRLASRTGLTGRVGLHQVRHTVATTWVASGRIEAAQHRLRHSKLDTTLRHYVDTTSVLDDVDVADALERLYEGRIEANGLSES